MKGAGAPIMFFLRLVSVEHLMILVTRPAPTVRPPCDRETQTSSMAMG